MIKRKFLWGGIKSRAIKSKIAAVIFKGVHRLGKSRWALRGRNSYRNSRSLEIGWWEKKEKGRQYRAPTDMHCCVEKQRAEGSKAVMG